MTSARPGVLERVGLGALVLGAVVLTLGTAYLVPNQPQIALALAFVVFIGILALVNPVTLPLLAMPLSVVVFRVGVGGVDMTVSDFAIGLAFFPAVLLVPRPFSPPLRQLLWLNAIYQALTLFTLVVNPFAENLIEWVHAWLLVSGALIVGWAVGATGNARAGLTLFLIACLGLAVATVAQGLLQFAAGNFSAVFPRWPWSMHKNLIGNLLGIAALVLYARPHWMGWSRRAALPVLGVLLAGLAFSQSRQALIGLAVGILIVSIRKHADRRRATVALIATLPIGYAVVTMARDQIASGNLHNSWFQRLEWYLDSLRIWSQSPWFGHGLRYWTQEDAPGAFQPPNAFLEVSASAGLVGLLGFLIFWVGLMVVLYRMDPTFGTLALALGLSRLAQSQLDLFWVSISVSVPFLLIGVCLGLADYRHRQDAPTNKRARVPVA